MKAKTLDKKYDENKTDIVGELDLSTIKTQSGLMSIFGYGLNLSIEKLHVSDVTRQSINKVWLAERLAQTTYCSASSGVK